MSTKKPDTVTITVLTSGLSLPGPSNPNAIWATAGRTALRGEVVEVERSETLDRNGDSWLDMDDEAQLARWSVVRFRVGDHVEAEGIRYIGEDDERITYRRREREVHEARKIADAVQRKAELNRIYALYGAPDSGQRTLSEG
ncbi:hypothetical protein KEC56_12620 [Microbacterium sp. YMB-B2]|uniref:Uncharacterized protein n=1 Tax=Microbacterium tenebrionis TaxID=2830665 RepID=A0A9X1S1M1_9MICO|nr:hypothetical protein [Microbacterium tenebrionis]MCC2030345.1 hypothetical protein [Microbacterium tenebrionis]